MRVQLCWHLMCDKGKISSEVHIVDKLNLVDDSSGVHVASYSSVGAPEAALFPRLPTMPYSLFLSFIKLECDHR